MPAFELCYTVNGAGQSHDEQKPETDVLSLLRNSDKIVRMWIV